MWAARCLHEAQLNGINNCFITLTYDDENAPSDYSLHYSDFQKFMRRLRKGNKNTIIRFYMAGEYGEQFQRPHFHACIFNKRFSDQKYHSTTAAGGKIYTSDELAKYWTHGFSSTAELNYLTAAYVARYIMKKITGDAAYAHYETLDRETGELKQRSPEFNHMSLKPGIGTEWYERFKSDVYPHGKLVVDGKEILPPRFYDKKYKRTNPEEYELIQLARYKETNAKYLDNTPERLAVKETVKRAQVNQLKRTLT